MSEELYAVLSPLLAEVGLELVDLEIAAHRVLVTVDRDGGVDLDSLAAANRTVSAILDEREPFPGRYTLEVSSPGLERRLRTPVHFARAVGETISVRTLPGTGPVRRVQGRLVSCDDTGFVMDGDEVPGGSLQLTYDAVERVRTVFAWGSTAPGAPRRPSAGGKAKSKGKTTASTKATTKANANPKGRATSSARATGATRQGPNNENDATTERVMTP